MFRFAATIFVSAFLLFQIQPLIGRFILPWFGGGPSVWTGCMLFFQMLLLGGYLYAHLTATCLSRRRQVVVHGSLLLISLLFLPIGPGNSWKPTGGEQPLKQIMILLLATVGVPYFALSSTGPLMQRWFSQTSPGKSPYRLYALSNVGSLLALLSYPFVFEPWLTLKVQTWSWSAVYLGYVGLAVWCGTALWKVPCDVPSTTHPMRSAGDPERDVPRPGIPMMLLWVVLAACGSAVLLATTNQLCIDVATVPFLWILPLSLYLISFIICFDSPAWYDRRAWGMLLIGCGPLACWVLEAGANSGIIQQIVIYSTVLLACCMTCHGELASLKPHPRHLTLYFVLISCGGALGGSFVAILAPAVFRGYWEYHIALTACWAATLTAWCMQRLWLKSPSLFAWIWIFLVAVQASVILKFVYSPLSLTMSAGQQTLVFGVLVLIHLTGLLVIGQLSERRQWGFMGMFFFSVIGVTWIYGYCRWKLPGQLNPPLVRTLIALAILPVLCGICSVLTADRLNEQSRRHVLLGSLYTIVAGFLYWSYEENLIEFWQLQSFGCTAAAGLMMEWSARGFRGPEKPSLGFWFWVPSITVILLLSNRLAEIVQADNEDTADEAVIHMSRNFYGVLRVKQETFAEDDDDENLTPPRKSLIHGQIRHGFQFIDDYWKRQPTTYYGRESGIGLAITQSRESDTSVERRPLRVGVVGLGTGTIAAYGEEGDYFRFYDINPDVVKLSDSIFTYLSDSAADTEVVIGDARIMMERELSAGSSQQFDVLAIDAFSSDAIPVHLLTNECGEIYRAHLKPDGILAVHISNRFLDLSPVCRGMAEHLGWNAVRIENGNDAISGVFSSTWVLLTPRFDLTAMPDIEMFQDPWTDQDRILHWTDDYSGLWQVLTF